MDSQSKLAFAAKAKTRFWYEQPSDTNPYLAKTCRLHGYDILELSNKKSFADVLYLLFCGELPSVLQKRLLEKLMIALINPGPRHPAGRAAMTSGICKTRAVHILPVSLMTLGGNHLGAGEVEQAMQFFRHNRDREPQEIVQKLQFKKTPPKQGDWHIIPGIGSRFGDCDPIPNLLSTELAKIEIANTIRWGSELIKALSNDRIGWLNTGITAAALIDLGINPREGAGIFQLISAPGLLAHGMEQSHHPITDMPFIKDEDYVIE